MSKKEWVDTLKEEGFASDATFDATIKKLEADLKKARKKDADAEDVENVSHLVALSVLDVLILWVGGASIVPPGGRPRRRGKPAVPSSSRYHVNQRVDSWTKKA